MREVNWREWEDDLDVAENRDRKAIPLWPLIVGAIAYLIWRNR